MNRGVAVGDGHDQGWYGELNEFETLGVVLILRAFFSRVWVHVALLGIIVLLGSIGIGCVTGCYVSSIFCCVSTDVMAA
jgi:uncharacterized membrane protein